MRRVIVAVLLAAVMCAPAFGGSLALISSIPTPTWGKGEPVPAYAQGKLWVRLYGGKQGQPKTLLDAVKWQATPITFRRPDNADTSQVHCYWQTLALDMDGDGKINAASPGIDVEGPPSTEVCTTFKDSEPIFTLLAPPPLSPLAPVPQ